MKAIIHISGSPGAGKTTLGNELQRLYPNAIVKDTDEFAKSLSQEDGSFFIKQLTRRIQHFIELHSERSIIFVGILDVTNDGITRMVDMNELATHLFYLDVSPEQLLRQFYTRITEHGKSNSNVWKDIAQGRLIVPSSQEKLMDAETSKKHHTELGYAIQSQSGILNSIDSLLCSKCQLTAHKKCAICNVRFCGASCQTITCNHDKQEYLSYIDTNYIFGTKDQFTLWRNRSILIGKEGSNTQIDKQVTERVFQLLDLSLFHKYTKDDHPQCCDIPYRIIEYGGNGRWIAKMEDVSELANALFKLK
jgi:broad-specificity NMP kinase